MDGRVPDVGRLFFLGLGACDWICRNSTGSTLNTILMDVGDLSMMLAGEWDEEDFGRSDLDVRGLMGESIFLLLPFVWGRLALSMSMVFLAPAPSICRAFD